MPQELLFLRQLFGGAADGWLSAAYLVGLIAVLAFRPEKIRMPGLFRVACILFALSVIVPAALMAFFAMLEGTGGMMGRRGPSGDWMALLPLLNATGPILLGASVLCALIALIPIRREPAPLEPPRHPLE